VPAADEIRACVADGFSDGELGAHFGRSKSWALYMRRKYAIAAAVPQGHHADESPQAFGHRPGSETLLAARDARWHRVNGNYPAYAEAQIRRFERAWAMAHPRRGAGSGEVTARFFGDPAPGRARAGEGARAESVARTMSSACVATPLPTLPLKGGGEEVEGRGEAKTTVSSSSLSLTSSSSSTSALPSSSSESPSISLSSAASFSSPSPLEGEGGEGGGVSASTDNAVACAR
jgi:hypothetical protein